LRAIGVENGVIGILPTLMQKTASRSTLILDEPVTITVAEMIDPV
jgi:hypothetical protein